MRNIPSKSVDMILTDLPYGCTKNKWDVVIPFNSMWECYERIIKDNGAIVLFADGMFMAELMMSNKKLWRYNIVWNKVNPVGFLNAKKQPLRSHEEMVVFYKKPPTYNPQFVKGAKNHSRGNRNKSMTNNNYGDFHIVDIDRELDGNKYPKSIWTFKRVAPSKYTHPTEKPLDLMVELVRTYTNEGDLILDSCCGAGTTGVAAKGLNRDYICIEKEENYYIYADKRIYDTERGGLLE